MDEEKTPLLSDTSLDIFSQPPVIESFLDTRELRISPSDSWKSGNLIQFYLPRYDSLLYVSDSFYLHTKFRIVDDKGNHLTEDSKVAPINGIGITAFQSITCQIGTEFICGDSRYDVYKTYLDLLFGYGKDAKEYLLRPTLMYYEDDANNFNNTNVMPKEKKNTESEITIGTSAAEEEKKKEIKLPSAINRALENSAFIWKRDKFLNKNSVETCAKLIYPLSQKSRILPPGIQMNFSLKRNDDAFVLLNGDSKKKYKLLIEDIYLTCKVRVPTTKVFENLTKNFIAGNGLARYDFLRKSLSGPYFLPENSQSQFNFTIFKDVAPIVAFVFMVPVNAVHGSDEENPFRFTNPRYKSIYIECEGNKYGNYSFSNEEFSMNSDQNQAKKCFFDLYQTLDQHYGGINSAIDFDSWVAGTTIVAIQLSENLPSLEYTSEQKTGDCRLIFELEDSLPENTYLFVLGVFNGVIFIDAASGLQKNYLR